MDWSLTPAAILVRGLARIAEGFLAGWVVSAFRLRVFPRKERERDREGGREGERFAFVARLRSGRSGVVLLAFSVCTATGEVVTKSESPFTSASTTAMVFTSARASV